MHRIHIIITLAFLSFIPSECYAQGIIFSQFENAPLNLNPAMTGNFEGNHRMGFNYRNQWPSFLGENSYQTGILSYDTHLDLKSNDQIGLGFSGTHDVAGSLNFRTSNFSLLSSYIHYFGDRFKDHHSITLGSSLALGNKKLESENANWPDQEPLQDTLYSKTFFNFSSGIIVQTPYLDSRWG